MILTDIHCHILPGVDDGAPDMTVTKDMLDKMYDEGVRRIIATPHYRVGMFEPSIRSIQSSYLEVKNYARTIGKYGMMVKLGCEYHRDDNMVGNLQAHRRPTMAGSQYVLVEFSSMDSYLKIRSVVYEVVVGGFIPIIAHIERYPSIVEDPGVVADLIGLGALMLCYANTGGFGIDGCLSSCIGAAISNPKKEHYLIIGDLAFFYDLNSICNAIPCNVHILLVNNGVGTEFKNYDNRAAMFGMDADPFMAAKGHNGFRNSELVKKLCANLGVMYMCAFSKEEYNRQKEQWLCKHKSPVLLEVFTNDKEESQALLMMNSLAKNTGIKAELRKTLVYKFAKRLFRR